MNKLFQLSKTFLQKFTYGIIFFIVAFAVIAGFSLLVLHFSVTLDEVSSVTDLANQITFPLVVTQLTLGVLAFFFWHRLFDFAFEKRWIAEIKRSKLVHMRWNYLAIFLSVIVLMILTVRS